jgi:hypothetical protein
LDALYGFAFRLCHDAQQSEDLVQETFARCLGTSEPSRRAGQQRESLVVVLLDLEGFSAIFTTGAKPAGLVHNSALLHSLPMPDCVYKAFHTWQMTDEEKMGVVWKLRAIPPKVL